jgi:hypothetical protein
MTNLEWLKAQIAQHEIEVFLPSLLQVRKAIECYLPERIRRFSFLLDRPTDVQSWLKVMLKIDILISQHGKLIGIGEVPYIYPDVLERLQVEKFMKARQALGIEHHIMVAIDEKLRPEFNSVLLGCYECSIKEQGCAALDFVPPRCRLEQPSLECEYQSDDAFRIMRSQFKYVLREVMDGREPLPDKASRAVSFAKDFPNDPYYSTAKMTHIVKAYLDGKLSLEKCPQPMQEAIAVYQFTQSIRSIQAKMTQSNMS